MSFSEITTALFAEYDKVVLNPSKESVSNLFKRIDEVALKALNQPSADKKQWEGLQERVKGDVSDDFKDRLNEINPMIFTIRREEKPSQDQPKPKPKLAVDTKRESEAKAQSEESSIIETFTELLNNPTPANIDLIEQQLPYLSSNVQLFLSARLEEICRKKREAIDFLAKRRENFAGSQSDGFVMIEHISDQQGGAAAIPNYEGGAAANPAQAKPSQPLTDIELTINSIINDAENEADLALPRDMLSQFDKDSSCFDKVIIKFLSFGQLVEAHSFVQSLSNVKIQDRLKTLLPSFEKESVVEEQPTALQRLFDGEKPFEILVSFSKHDAHYHDMILALMTIFTILSKEKREDVKKLVNQVQNAHLKQGLISLCERVESLNPKQAELSKILLEFKKVVDHEDFVTKLPNHTDSQKIIRDLALCFFVLQLLEEHEGELDEDILNQASRQLSDANLVIGITYLINKLS